MGGCPYTFPALCGNGYCHRTFLADNGGSIPSKTYGAACRQSRPEKFSSTCSSPRCHGGNTFGLVMVSARELKLDNLPEKSQTYDKRFKYTHGFGITLTNVNEFTPKKRQVMIGWIDGLCDPGSYGKMIAYQFPKDKRVLGPQQAETGAYPELRLVAVMHDDNLSYAATFDTALEQLFEDRTELLDLAGRPAPEAHSWM
jgi:uncharacterized membrane protein (UPF0182 family)